MPKAFRNIIRQLQYREGSFLYTTHRTALWISTLGTFTSTSRRIDIASLNCILETFRKCGIVFCFWLYYLPTRLMLIVFSILLQVRSVITCLSILTLLHPIMVFLARKGRNSYNSVCLNNQENSNNLTNKNNIHITLNNKDTLLDEVTWLTNVIK